MTQRRMRRAAGWVLVTGLALPLPAAEHWQVQFPAGRTRLDLNFNDLQFASPTRGVGVGYAGEGAKRAPAALVTADGGTTWSLVRTEEAGLSLFFLNETTGWMVTAGGLWKTTNSGRNWSKLTGRSAVAGISHVHFLDENRGWAVGSRKSVYATSDGGRTWSRVAAADEVECNPDFTVYDWITFVNDRFGMIAGGSFPPQPGATTHRELPHLTIFLETRDGGKAWKASTTSMFGRVAKVLFAPDGRGLGLVEFRSDFEFPSEVFAIDWATGKSRRAFRRADRAVTDIAFAGTGTAYLAAVEQPAGKRSRPAPGKLKVLKSADLVDWKEMEVDAHAKAHKAMLTVAGADQAWVATDTGMILRLEPK